MHTILSICLDIRTIRFKPWIQHEEFLGSDPPSIGEKSTSAAVDLEPFRAARDPTDMLSSSDGPRGNERTERKPMFNSVGNHSCSNYIPARPR